MKRIIEAQRRFAERVQRGRQEGKIGYILLWLLGVPIPVLLFLFVIRGCTYRAAGRISICEHLRHLWIFSSADDADLRR